jgi:cell wall-associated NlpC family hydrolase
MHWATQYLGKKWVSGARGPDTFDCWGLVQFVEKKHYNRDLPDFPIDAHALARIAVEIDEQSKNGTWEQIPKPVDGCIVALGHNQRFHHVGLYLEVDGGFILHSLDHHGVLCTPTARLKSSGWNRVAYYRHTSWPS